MKWIWLVAALAACGGKDDAGGDPPAGSAGTPAPDTGPRATIVDAWKKGGLAPSAFVVATVPIGKDCTSGTVNNLEVVMCQFASADDAKAGEKAGWTWVGETTGTAWTSGTVVIAAADRKASDKNGKMMNQLMKLAPK